MIRGYSNGIVWSLSMSPPFVISDLQDVAYNAHAFILFVNSWSMLGYPIPKEKRKRLAILYFHICTTPGMPYHILAACTALAVSTGLGGWQAESRGTYKTTTSRCARNSSSSSYFHYILALPSGEMIPSNRVRTSMSYSTKMIMKCKMFIPMIRPPFPCFIICCAAYLQQNNTPLTFTANVLSKRDVST